MNIKHILVATDLSREATSCIPTVAELARGTGARITLLHVAESVDAIPHGAPLAPPLRQAQDPKAMEATRQQLEARGKSFGSDIVVDSKVVTGGNPAEEVTSYAHANEVDLIAVTTHGRTGVRRVVLGSVAEAVIRLSRVPVLVLPLPRG